MVLWMQAMNMLLQLKDNYSTVCVYILVHRLLWIKLLQTQHSFIDGSWISLGTLYQTPWN